MDLNFENPEHKPTSDLGYSLPGVGVLGAGRSIGLSGYSFPDPDVQAKKSGDIPGQNADENFSSQMQMAKTRSTSELPKTKPELKQNRSGKDNLDEYETEEEDEDDKEARELNGFFCPPKK